MAELIADSPFYSQTITVLEKIQEQAILKGKSIDGIYFKKAKSNETNNLYAIDFINFGQETKTYFNEDIGSYSWMVLLFENNMEHCDVAYFSAVLGDPLTFVNNQIKSGDTQGFIAKKSITALKIIKELLEKYNLNIIKEQVMIDLTFLETEALKANTI